ncbi:MAG TPA: bifunctional oligoribonuclease/PAP phosphatase NrnA [Syntrophales bacterium]|nr:bifunctional oligoribonuclease/PAP phosphatase NrnA [Syntrophales bacterium]
MGQNGTNNIARLEKLHELIRGKRKVLIVTHNHPDPDALASAFALKYLFQSRWKVGSIIASSGIVGRAENRAMIRQLKIDLKPLAEVNLKNFSIIALVDTQPGAGNNSLPKSIIPDIVIDHHVPVRAKTRLAQYYDIRTDYGSTSTILAEYLRDAGIEEMNRKVATALLYGIRSDTRDLGRGVSPKDVDACMYFYQRVLFRLLSQIEHPEVPRDYLSILEKAIRNARIYKDVVTLDLGHVEHLEIIAEMADLMVRVEGVKWVLSLGEFVGDLYFSLRTKKRLGSADRIAQKMVADLGSGGGHEMMAGGKIPSADHPHHSHQELTEILMSRFLKAVKRRETKAQTLLSFSQEVAGPQEPPSVDKPVPQPASPLPSAMSPLKNRPESPSSS